MTQSATAQTALKLARLQIAVFPLAPGTTQPLEDGGLRTATHDLGQVHEWWTREPNANIGLPTGPGGFDVVDIDTYPGGTGFAAYRELTERGLLDGWMMQVATPNNGLHLYFPATAYGQADRSWPHAGIDFRGEGGYVAAPPSTVLRDDGGIGTYTIIERRTDRALFVDADAIGCQLPAPRDQHRDEQIAARVAGLANKVREATGAKRAPLLSWAARTCVEIGADPAPIAQAAAEAGLDSRAIHRTVTAATARAHTSGLPSPAPTALDIAPSADPREVTGP